MKILPFVLIIAQILMAKAADADENWLIYKYYSPGDTVAVSPTEPPPFLKWHKNVIGYNIDESAPPGFTDQITAAFDSWEVNNNLSFINGSDILIKEVSGNYGAFALVLFWFYENTGEIYDSEIWFIDYNNVVWTNGIMSIQDASPPDSMDVQSLMAHEIGHTLGIAHPLTGDGEPTMANRMQVPSFDYTLKQRTLESDDTAALDFLYRKLFVPQEFTTINSALSIANSPDSVIVNGRLDPYVSADHLTVNSGVVLKLKENTKIKMAASKRIYVYGKLDAYYTTFSYDGTGWTGAWGGIYLYTNASHASAINHCTIEYPYYGIYLHNNQTHNITNSMIKRCTYGIYGDAGGTPYCTNNTVDSCDYGGIRLYNNSNMKISETTVKNAYYAGVYCDASSPEIWDSYLRNNGQNGLYCYNQANPNLIPSYECFRTRIYDNNSDEVYCDYSFPKLGDTSVNPYAPTHSQVTDDSGYLIYLRGGSNVKAEKVWWGQSPPDVNRFYLAAGTTLDYDPWAEQSLGKNAMISGEDNPSTFELGRRLINQGKYREGIAELKNQIDEFPNSQDSYYALLDLYSLEGSGLYEPHAGDFLVYLDGVVTRESALRDPGLSLAAVVLANRGFYGDADAVYAYFLSDKEKRTRYILNQCFNFYLFHCVDFHKASEILSMLKESDAGEYIKMMAESDYEQMSATNQPLTGEKKRSGFFRLVDEFAPKAAATVSLPTEYNLHSAFPNPFNPSTTIRFDVPEAGNVRITIFNVLGQRVAEIVNDNIPAGSHERIWDASRLGSGIYLVRMEAKEFSRTMKVTLLK